jgi:CRP-like cAMP-binding protein
MSFKNYPTYLKPLIDLLERMHPISEAIGQQIIAHTEQISVRSGQVLLASGEPNKYLYFIVKGAIRGHFCNQKKDITTWISTEGALATSITAISGGSLTLECMQAIEDADLLRVPIQSVEQLYDQDIEFNIFGRKVFQAYYSDAERRAYVVRLSSAEEKYLFFLEHYAHLANRIQLKYIASFLGITMETLSRVRRKISYS